MQSAMSSFWRAAAALCAVMAVAFAVVAVLARPWGEDAPPVPVVPGQRVVVPDSTPGRVILLYGGPSQATDNATADSLPACKAYTTAGRRAPLSALNSLRVIGRKDRTIQGHRVEPLYEVAPVAHAIECVGGSSLYLAGAAKDLTPVRVLFAILAAMAALGVVITLAFASAGFGARRPTGPQAWTSQGPASPTSAGRPWARPPQH